MALLIKMLCWLLQAFVFLFIGSYLIQYEWIGVVLIGILVAAAVIFLSD